MLGFLILFQNCGEFKRTSAAKVKGYTEQESLIIAEYNRRIAETDSFTTASTVNLKPYVETQDAGYLIFSANTSFKSLAVKRKLAENLKNAQLIVYTGDNWSGEAQRIVDMYKDVIDERLINVVYLPDDQAKTSFWTRDGLPLPSFDNSGQFTVTDAKYYHLFEPDIGVKKLFNSERKRHPYYFEGGNFVVNGRGDCLIVDNLRVQSIPDRVFSSHYGCKKLIRLPHLKGIGHADESVKFISDNHILTDLSEYKKLLEQEGFTVTRINRPSGGSYRTYMNSLVINNRVFVPIFGNTSEDDKAIATYKSLNLGKVIPINSKTLSDKGRGSIHCITMTYPKVPMDRLLNNSEVKVLKYATIGVY